jgi:hypothetical protein
VAVVAADSSLIMLIMVQWGQQEIPNESVVSAVVPDMGTKFTMLDRIPNNFVPEKYCPIKQLFQSPPSSIFLKIYEIPEKPGKQNPWNELRFLCCCWCGGTNNLGLPTATSPVPVPLLVL